MAGFAVSVKLIDLATGPQANINKAIGGLDRTAKKVAREGGLFEARDALKGIRELIIAPRKEHSRKPVQARERIEAYAEGPCCELFAREAARGWLAWGNQTNKFAPHP
jgi:N6-adenosine-specific RNA methylase IME4